MMSNWSKSKKLTVTTSTSGTPKNTSSRQARGATRRWWPPPGRLTLRRDELVPLTNHVAVLVHQRVPAGDLAHALPEGAAVAHLTRLLHERAIGVLDVALGRLAVIPVAPLVGRHELLGGLGDRAVVALLGDESALPARLVPVEVVVGGVELEALQVPHRGDAARPGAVAFLERSVVARDAAGPHGRHGRRPHRLDHHFPRRHQVDRLVEGRPEGPELARLFRVDQDLDGLVDLLLGHVALVAVLDVAARLDRHRGVHDADRGHVEDRGLALELRL